jgi:hypothetical protein
MIPGSNLLMEAFGSIDPVPFMYYPFVSRTLNTSRQWMTTYGTPYQVWGSVQAVPRSKYNELGLDFQKEYIKILAPINSVDLARDTSGDQFEWKGFMYQMVDDTNWYAMDGWARCMGAQIGVSPTAV